MAGLIRPFDAKCQQLENIIETVQCFNCKDVPGLSGVEMNRYNCVDKAHALCEDCKEDKCPCGDPPCESLVAKCPNPTIQQVLKDLPAYCPRYKIGCRKIFADLENLENHGKDCIFRKVYCPFSGYCQGIHGWP